MAFDIISEKRKLDRFLTYVTLKYELFDVQWQFECEDKILDVYRRFMESQITSSTKFGKARQAFFANAKFCEIFREYFDMHWDLFGDNAQYFAWHYYCYYELDLNKGPEDKWKFIEGKDTLVWEKPIEGAFYKPSQKYKTWQDPMHGMIAEDNAW